MRLELILSRHEYGLSHIYWETRWAAEPNLSAVYIVDADWFGHAWLEWDDEALMLKATFHRGPPGATLAQQHLIAYELIRGDYPFHMIRSVKHSMEQAALERNVR